MNNDGKLLALISHIFIIGTLIAWILNLKKNNEFASFYTRQMIGWHLVFCLNTAIVLNLLQLNFIKWIIGVVLLLVWALSFLSALSGKKKEMLFLGKYFQHWFRSL